MEIRLRADIARLQADMDQARRTVGSAMDRVSASVGSAMKMFAGLAAGLSVAAFSAWIKGAIDAADAASKLSQKTGVAVKDLAGLQLAYNLGGAGGDVFEKSMVKLSKAITEGNKGLSALGIKTASTNGQLLSNKDVLYSVADAFQKMDDGARKTSMAVEIFGKSGATLIPLLNGGAQGFRDMEEMAQKLGLTMSEKTAKSAEAFNDNLDLLAMGSQGVARQIAAEMLPTLSSLSGSLLTSMTSGDKLKSTADFLSTGLKLLYSVAVGIVEIFSTVGKVIGGLAVILTNNLSNAVNVISKIVKGDFAGAWEAAKGTVTDFKNTTSIVAGEIGDSWKGTAKTISDAWSGAGDAGVEAMAKQKKAEKDLLADQAKREAAAKKSAKEYETAVKNANDFIAALQIERSQIGLSADQLKMMAAARATAKAPTEELRMAIMGEALALDIAAKAGIAKADADKAIAAANAKVTGEVESINAETKSLLDKIKTYEMLPEAITRAKIAELEASKRSVVLTDEGISDIQRRIDALGDLAAAQSDVSKLGQGSSVANAKELIDIMVQVDEATKSAAAGMAESFGRVGSAIGSLTTALSGYGRAQATIAAQLAASMKDAAGDPAKISQATALAARQSAQAQVKSYGDMAGAAKGFFKENSTGYKVMEGAEKAFRAAEMAMAIQNMLSKSGLLTAFTGLFVASKATQTTVEAGATATSTTMAGAQASAWGVTAVVKAIASMPFPANLAAGAATLAAVVAIGAKIAGGIGGGSSGGGQSAADAQKTQGTGGVFGDVDAKSASIARSLDLLEKNSDSLIPINRGMLSALNAIKNSMVGLTNLLVREPGLTNGTNMGIQTGQLDIGKPTDGISKQMTIITKTLFAGFGDKIASFVNNLWGKTTQNIVDSGLQFGGSVRGLQAGQGFNQYASVDTTKSSFFGLSKKTTNSLQTQGLSSELTAQFGQIFTNVEKALSTAAAGLGIGSASVAAALDALVIDVTKVSLKGLTGTALTEALNAVVSKTMDEMAQAAIPGMDAFRQVGEGYAETVIQLASNYAQLDGALQSIGMTFGATGVSSLTAREALIAMAGGIDKFTEQAGGFAQNFLTEAERLAPVQKYVTEELGRMGLAGITTRDQFKDIVLGLNVSTAAGAETYTALMALQEAFALVVPALEDAGSAAKTAAQVMDERRSLQNQLDELVMSSAQLRDKERMSLDETNRSLFDRIIAEREAQEVIANAAATSKAAADAAAASAKESADKLAAANQSWQKQIDDFLKSQMTAAEVRDLELAGMDDSTKVLVLRLEALKAEKQALDDLNAATASVGDRWLADMNRRSAGTVAIQEKATAEIIDLSSQRAAMELTLFNLTHDAAAQLARARQLELEGMDASLRPLQSQIYAMQDQASAAALAATALENAAASARAIATERGGLQREMFQVQGNTAALRKLELDALDPSNRALKESIFALQDKMAADQAASAAAEQMAQAMAAAAAESRRAADELKKSWQGATDSIFDEVARIRGLTGAGGGDSLASAQARFTVTSAQARSGNQEATRLLPGLSQALDALEAANAVTQFDLSRMRAQRAASLLQTGSGLASQFGLSIPGFAAGGEHAGGWRIVGENGPELEATGPSRIFNSSQSQSMLGGDTSALEEKIVVMTKAISRLESALDKIARDSNRTANIQQGIADGDIIVQTEVA
ncbi:MAG: hypothetical protein V4684_19535 [Pseudomonadota bacterium]